MSHQNFIVRIFKDIKNILNYFSPLGLLMIRLYVGLAFFRSGYIKFTSFSNALMLFEHEYKVPILPAYHAAVLGTFMEVVLPILVALGLLGRLSALGLFMFNFIALWSYPVLWTAGGHAGFMQHIYWGMLLMVVMLFGPGKLSIDCCLLKLFCSKMSKSNKAT